MQKIELIQPSPKWRPRGVFSASQLAVFDRCQRKWAYRYIFGIREGKTTEGRLLGSLIHACLEAFLRGGNVYQYTIEPSLQKEIEAFGDPVKVEELKREAPQRALAGLHFLPRLDDPALQFIEVERWLQVNAAEVLPEYKGADIKNDPLKFNGKLDLTVGRAGVVYLYDHKSTRGDVRNREPWAYCHDPESLADDIQANLYALDIMQRHGLQELWIRWVYYLTDRKRHPDARAVDVCMSREKVEARCRELFARAYEMRLLVRQQLGRDCGVSIDQLPLPVLPPAEDSPCDDFGGCPYRSDRGGPCTAATQNVGALVAAAPMTKTKTPKEKPKATKMEQQELPATQPQQPALPALPDGLEHVQQGGTWTVQPKGATVQQTQAQVPNPNPMQPPETATAPAAAAPVPSPTPAAQPTPAVPSPTPEAPAAAAPAPAPEPDKPEPKPKTRRTSKSKGVSPDDLEDVVAKARAHGLTGLDLHADGSIAGIKL